MTGQGSPLATWQHHVERGNPAGPPVAFIHGFMSSNLQWRPNLERLGEELRMVLIEQPGHGRSPAPEDPAGYAPAAVVAGLEAVREQVGVDRWWLVGHSMGGAIALRYALAHPDRICGVVFTNSRAVFGIRSTNDSGDRAATAITPDVDLRSLPYHPVNASRFPADLRAAMIEAADAMSGSVLSNVGATAAQWRSFSELSAVIPRVLLVNGKWEKAFQPHVEQAKQAIPDLTVVDLDGGHSINIENPEGFDTAVLSFVSDSVA